MSSKNVVPKDLYDIQDNIIQLNEALLSVVDLMAGCGDNDAPPISYLWRLMAILSKYCDSIEKDLTKAIKSS